MFKDQTFSFYLFLIKCFNFELTFIALFLLLYRRGYADGEIEALFCKYDADGSRYLDQEEQRRLRQDLESQRVAIEGKMRERERERERERDRQTDRQTDRSFVFNC